MFLEVNATYHLSIYNSSTASLALPSRSPLLSCLGVHFCPYILGVHSLLWLHYVVVPPVFTLVGFGPSRLVLATTTFADFLSFVVTTGSR